MGLRGLIPSDGRRGTDNDDGPPIPSSREGEGVFIGSGVAGWFGKSVHTLIDVSTYLTQSRALRHIQRLPSSRSILFLASSTAMVNRGWWD